MNKRPTFAAASAKMESLKKVIAQSYGVGVGDLEGVGRTANVAFARQVGMYVAREVLNFPFETIAICLNRTHGTVMYACQSIANFITTCPNTHGEVDKIMAIMGAVKDKAPANDLAFQSPEFQRGFAAGLKFANQP